MNGIVAKTASLSIQTTSPASTSSQPSDVKIIIVSFPATEDIIRELLAGYKGQERLHQTRQGILFR
jgi:hypothetical protein